MAGQRGNRLEEKKEVKRKKRKGTKRHETKQLRKERTNGPTRVLLAQLKLHLKPPSCLSIRKLLWMVLRQRGCTFACVLEVLYMFEPSVTHEETEESEEGWARDVRSMQFGIGSAVTVGLADTSTTKK